MRGGRRRGRRGKLWLWRRGGRNRRRRTKKRTARRLKKRRKGRSFQSWNWGGSAGNRILGVGNQKIVHLQKMKLV